MPTPPAMRTNRSEVSPSRVKAPCGPVEEDPTARLEAGDELAEVADALDGELLAPRLGGRRGDGEGVLLEDEGRGADLQPGELSRTEGHPAVPGGVEDEGHRGRGGAAHLVDDVAVPQRAQRPPHPPEGQRPEHDDGEADEPRPCLGEAGEVLEPEDVQRRREQGDVGQQHVREPPSLVPGAAPPPADAEPDEGDEGEGGDARRPDPRGRGAQVEHREPQPRAEHDGEHVERHEPHGGQGQRAVAPQQPFDAQVAGERAEAARQEEGEDEERGGPEGGDERDDAPAAAVRTVGGLPQRPHGDGHDDDDEQGPHGGGEAAPGRATAGRAAGCGRDDVHGGSSACRVLDTLLAGA